ncbi:uncharacterized protein LOC108742588 [Agrilus planipennis]|uniref:Uncharacterized protein LOC108742588 n=1 Tax=Agrilus planipennis TaxID=224129 RepID=A0A1W4XKR0_AGRPL|nr:uncharacterized protein LOC108742588 [Agrilus planipennis]
MFKNYLHKWLQNCTKIVETLYTRQQIDAGEFYDDFKKNANLNVFKACSDTSVLTYHVTSLHDSKDDQTSDHLIRRCSSQTCLYKESSKDCTENISFVKLEGKMAEEHLDITNKLKATIPVHSGGEFGYGKILDISSRDGHEFIICDRLGRELRCKINSEEDLKELTEILNNKKDLIKFIEAQTKGPQGKMIKEGENRDDNSEIDFEDAQSEWSDKKEKGLDSIYDLRNFVTFVNETRSSRIDEKEDYDIKILGDDSILNFLKTNLALTDHKIIYTPRERQSPGRQQHRCEIGEDYKMLFVLLPQNKQFSNISIDNRSSPHTVDSCIMEGTKCSANNSLRRSTSFTRTTKASDDPCSGKKIKPVEITNLNKKPATQRPDSVKRSRWTNTASTSSYYSSLLQKRKNNASEIKITAQKSNQNVDPKTKNNYATKYDRQIKKLPLSHSTYEEKLKEEVQNKKISQKNNLTPKRRNCSAQIVEPDKQKTNVILKKKPAPLKPSPSKPVEKTPKPNLQPVKPVSSRITSSSIKNRNVSSPVKPSKGKTSYTSTKNDVNKVQKEVIQNEIKKDTQNSSHIPILREKKKISSENIEQSQSYTVEELVENLVEDLVEDVNNQNSDSWIQSLDSDTQIVAASEKFHKTILNHRPIGNLEKLLQLLNHITLLIKIDNRTGKWNDTNEVWKDDTEMKTTLLQSRKHGTCYVYKVR